MIDNETYEALTDTQAEMTMIGAVIRDNSLITKFGLVPGDFSLVLLGRIWELGQDVIPKGGYLALGPLCQEMPDRANSLRMCVDLGGMAVTRLDVLASRLADLGARRRIMAASDDLVAALRSNETTPEEALARFRGDVGDAFRKSTGSTKSSVAESVVEAIKAPLPCYSTGLPTLDQVLGGGMFASKCYGIAARKKVGKTALAATISHNLNRRHVPHLFVAGEMSPLEIEQRNMAREFKINSVQFLTEQRHLLLKRAGEYVATQPNFTTYEHAPGISFEELRRVVANAKERHEAAGVILDYWQLVTGRAKGDTEEFHLRNVAQWLADECRRQKMWCMIFAQVNQDGNTRGGEGLKLAADVYFTLHREKDQPGAWLEMEESRYVLYANVGSEMHPGLYLNKHGPHFEDVADSRDQAA